MESLKQKLGARIQEIRKSKNLTQEVLAEKIDMDKPNLSNIESPKLLKNLLMLLKLKKKNYLILDISKIEKNL